MLSLERRLAWARFLGRMRARKHVTVELGSYFHKRIEPFAKQMRDLGGEVAGQVVANLQQLVAGTWTGTDDELFGPHTAYVSVAVRYYGCAAFPIKLWTAVIEPQVRKAEGLLNRPIHKGAPLFNAGLCFLVAGNVMHSAQYIDAAAEEDERRRAGSGKHVIIGSSGIAESVKLRLLYKWLKEVFGSDYRGATGSELTEAEVKSLVAFVASNTPDAVVVLFSLRSVMLLQKGPRSYAVRMYHVRALADLALALESSLSRWQTGRSRGLFNRSRAFLSGNAGALAAFDRLHSQYQGSDWTDPAVFNSMLSAAFSAFDAATLAAERAGVAVYFAYGCRNSLMHALDETLDVFTDLAKAERAIGFALVAFKLAKLSFEGAIGTI